MPPWIAAVRSAYVASNRGTTYLAMIKVSSRANTTAAIISATLGSSGFSARGTKSVIIEITRLAEDEGECNTDDRQRLSNGESDPSRAHHRAASLRLSRRALDDRGEDQANADAGANGAEAVTDDAEGSSDFHWS